MSNFSLVVDSTFQPFTYQELTAPLDRMEAYHEKLAQEYDNLSSQADILEAMGKNDRDKESGAYSRYKAYSDSLRREADNLYRYGLNYDSRRRLSDMRRRYNTDIVPIQNAWNKRDEEIKAQNSALEKNPGLIFTRDANQSSIDEYIDNPLGGYRTINPDNIYKDMYTAAKELEGQIRSGKVEGIDPYTAAYITKHGLDPAMISEWIADPSKNPTLTAMRDQVLIKNGVSPDVIGNSPNLQRILSASTNAAQLGAWAAVGEDKSQMMELYGPRLSAQANKEIAVANAKAGGSGSGAASSSPWFNFQQDSIPIASADKNNPAGYVSGYWQNYNNDSWNGKARTMRVQEVRGTDKDGKLQFKSDIINLGQLLSKNAKYNPNNEDVASFFISQDGQEGYVFQVNGKQYFADISADMSPNVKNARTSFADANKAVALRTAREQELKDLMVRTDVTPEQKRDLQIAINKEIQELNAIAEKYTSNALSSLGAAYNLFDSKNTQSVMNQPTQTQQGLFKGN